MEPDDSQTKWENGRDEVAKRGGYTTSDVEMVMPPAPEGPGAGSTDLDTPASDANASSSDD
jgi:hypothetical protein